MNEQLEFLKTIAWRLQSAHIPFMLTGSVAMSVYATPRMTRDIDADSVTSLDWRHLEHWASELGVGDALHDLRV